MPDLLRFLHARRAQTVAGCLGVLAVVTVLSGTNELDLPAGNTRGTATIPLWSVLPVCFAAVTTIGLHSGMGQHDLMAARRMWAIDVGHILAASLLATPVLAAALGATGGVQLAAGGVRNLLFYTGLALVSGRILRRTLSWAMPLVAIFLFIWFGTDAAGRPAAWAWVLCPATDPASWLAAATSLVIGCWALALSPWHLPYRRWRR